MLTLLELVRTEQYSSLASQKINKTNTPHVKTFAGVTFMDKFLMEDIIPMGMQVVPVVHLLLVLFLLPCPHMLVLTAIQHLVHIQFIGQI
jgi:hypothetical protein